MTPWTVAHQAYLSMGFPSKNTGVGCHVLLQGIFPTQGLNPALPHCRQILYHLSHQGSPRLLEWVAYPFSRGNFPVQELNYGLLHCRQILTSWAIRGNPEMGLLRAKRFQWPIHDQASRKQATLPRRRLIPATGGKKCALMNLRNAGSNLTKQCFFFCLLF